jgi:hypothetical protein
MNKDEGLLQLTKIVIDNITHQDYKRVTELADTYYKMVSGDEISELLHRITRRETEEEYEMRKLITNSVIPPTLASTKLPFQKTVRTKAKKRIIKWDEKEDENKKADFEKFLFNYWGDSSLEKFLEYAFVDYNYIDPNAFLITEFDNFDNLREKAKPYPFIATSEQCVMFEIKNNILEYLIVKLPIKFRESKTDERESDGIKYTIYLGQDTITFTQVSRAVISEGEMIDIGPVTYQIGYFEPKNDKVPARRFGYKRDAETQGRTFVSCFHDIIPYLNKTLKIDSELDLTAAMCAFPQRFAYVAPCKNCNKGKMPDGKDCPVCDGSGKEPFHNSTMDVITLDLPRDVVDIIDLEKLLVYKSPPIELLEWQKDYINELRANVFLMMFNKELYTKDEVAATATEKVLEIDNLNDTLRPFAQSLSTMWEFIVRDIATFTDFGKGLYVEHLYPEDFKFKSMSEMMLELQSAKTANASTSTIAKIEDDINEKLYADQPEDLKIIRIKNSFNPFRGYKEETIDLLISQGLTTRFNSVLYANLESIFNELEQENENLYELKYQLILEKVKAKVVEYMATMDKESAPEPKLNLGGENLPEEGQQMEGETNTETK